MGEVKGGYTIAKKNIGGVDYVTVDQRDNKTIKGIAQCTNHPALAGSEKGLHPKDCNVEKRKSWRLLSDICGIDLGEAALRVSKEPWHLGRRLAVSLLSCTAPELEATVRSNRPN
ncbi:hypothetical protein KY290_037913 [Solanum tuberosum]|uniref:Uncharacterized protein n=1 Tax=Solanum tuberosum TaxID=4113 RepID=A0ABQ7TYD3_SOLTU|nr:hypothetical protein KY290_037913 [Solanum tuberosum]